MNRSAPQIDTGLGELLRPGDPGYDAARRIWNGAIDRRPAFVCRCRSPAEVAAAVRFAASHDLLLAIKAGGHSIPGWSVCEGGLVIDLSPMKRIEIDAERRRARVGAGVLWGEYDAAAQAHGLASPGGEISHTGVAGLTLGGGIGWLSRTQGLACDLLESAEVVLADGSLVTASETEHPNLFWALRGGGGNFGVVTSFTFRLQPVKPAVAGFVMYGADQAQPVLENFARLAREAPDELSLVAAIVTAPPEPTIPADLRSQPVIAVAGCYFGPHDRGWAALEPVRRFGTPRVDTFSVQRYVDIQRWFDATVPHGLHYYCRSEWLGDLTPDACAQLANGGLQRSSPLSQVLIRRLGGAIARTPAEASAFHFRDAAYMLTLAAAWTPEDPAPERHRIWCRATWASLRPWSCGGGYVNHLTDEGPERVREAYGRDTWTRLATTKRRYDPANLFRMNQNIPPAP